MPAGPQAAAAAGRRGSSDTQEGGTCGTGQQLYSPRCPSPPCGARLPQPPPEQWPRLSGCLCPAFLWPFRGSSHILHCLKAQNTTSSSGAAQIPWKTGSPIPPTPRRKLLQQCSERRSCCFSPPPIFLATQEHLSPTTSCKPNPAKIPPSLYYSFPKLFCPAIIFPDLWHTLASCAGWFLRQSPHGLVYQALRKQPEG